MTLSKFLIFSFFLTKFAGYGGRKQTILHNRGSIQDSWRKHIAGQVLVRQFPAIHKAHPQQEGQPFLHGQGRGDFQDDSSPGQGVWNDAGGGSPEDEAKFFPNRPQA